MQRIWFAGLASIFASLLLTASYSVAKEVTVDEVIGGLENPWGFDFLPSGEIILTEREGRMR
ncbi:MAG: PQQ-dependent sugar dehydrogenase, partial [Alphaproteobacteria bacterium]|nr:PQQ-dependent sugar dehydrogenase [Alphaproteobacteria bacterium]